MSSELIILLFGIAIGTTIGMIGNGGVILILFFMYFENMVKVNNYLFIGNLQRV